MLSKDMQYALIVIFSTIGIIGTFSNIVSMLCLFKQWKNKPHVSNSQKILMSLIVSDLLTSAVSCPIQVANHFVKIPTHGYVLTTLSGVSTLTILLLALDKYLKVTMFPKYHDIVNDTRLRVAIVSCWVFPMVIMTSAWWHGVIYGLSNGLLTLTTLVALSVLNFFIYRYYKQSKRNLAKFSKPQTVDSPTATNRSYEASQPPPPDHTTTERSVAVKTMANDLNRKNQRKLAMKILVLMSTYFICTILYSSISFLSSFRVIGHSTVFNLAMAMYLANSMMNPIIYVFRDAKFRRTAKKMFAIKTSSVTVVKDD